MAARERIEHIEKCFMSFSLANSFTAITNCNRAREFASNFPFALFVFFCG
jgi:hypothetical protein